MLKVKKKILITGARGFIGKNLIKNFSKKYFIYATTSKTIKNKKNIEYINYSEGNLSIIKNLKIEYIINCHGRISNDNYENVYEDHYIFAENLLKNINKKYLKKIIHLGSVDEYGDNFSGKDRLIKKKPESNYGQIKLLVTKLFINYATKYNIDYIILRIFLVYGLNQKKPRIIPYLLDCIKKGNTANITDFTGKKTFIHIDELTQIIEIILFKKMKYKIYNLSTNNYIPVKRIVNFFNRYYGLKYIYSKKLLPKSQFFDNCRLFNEITIDNKNFFESLHKIAIYEKI